MTTPILPWFDLNNESAYQQWRRWKLNAYPVEWADLLTHVADPLNISDAERAQMQSHLDRYNLAIYQSSATEDQSIPLAVGAQFGLHRVDANLGADAGGVTEIEVKESALHQRYIPYGSKRLSWHVDGYYNPASRQIRGMMLQCVRPAKSGGETALLDIEMAYIYLRDMDHSLVAALFDEACLSIPANEAGGKQIRPTSVGPVFSFDQHGQLHMRYSARKRNIVWRADRQTRRAVEALERLMQSDSPWLLSGYLAAGQGLICNNVLHNRTEFEDSAERPRLLYRVRYLDRIATRASM